ncbi:MAG: S1 RNA-binding domain-containing protein [Lachnospiraceae bacterium]|jgi:small subunit ribosomal protein S1|nr:S1 RNA-binding domain-containing protein [Lachnospiraceae bacterium]
MNEEVKNMEVNAAEAMEAAAAEPKAAEAEAVNAAESAAEPVKAETEKAETMADFANELEASYKEFDQRRNDYQEQEGPDAQKWANLLEMMQNKTVAKVKVKEVVKSGVVAYIDEIQGFIPASHISTRYVEKLEDYVGKYLEVVPITVEPERKKLVLSARVVMKEKEAAEKAEKMSAVKVGAVLEGTVDSIKDYGAFVDLETGVTGLLHVSQISAQRIKNPGVVLKEGQKVKVKVIGVGDGRISLSMKALEQGEETKEEVFHYKESGAATTGLASLLKDIKL